MHWVCVSFQISVWDDVVVESFVVVGVAELAVITVCCLGRVSVRVKILESLGYHEALFA